MSDHQDLFFSRWFRNAAEALERKDVGQSVSVHLHRVEAVRGRDTVYYRAMDLDGGVALRQTFPRDEWPHDIATFWSVIAFDGANRKLIPNSLNRHLLSKNSELQPNANGSLTLYFGPRPPESLPNANWLPTRSGRKYNLIYRFCSPGNVMAHSRYELPILIGRRYPQEVPLSLGRRNRPKPR